mmetsp:Transcript_26809/g.40567  ORF Transcript_26809/g.40567 Transcript_26809/m.40567 type:complete len:162 (-) Transcript_26809:308-793(-)
MIGAQGVPLIYIIRQEEAAVFDEDIPYDVAIIQAAALDGPEFQVDAQTVHTLILNNVHEDSDAYTYNKPLLRHRNGRCNIIALRERYHSDVTKQAIINTAKSVLENLRYKNEKSFSFEGFSSKLQKAYPDTMQSTRRQWRHCGRVMGKGAGHRLAVLPCSP